MSKDLLCFLLLVAPVLTALVVFTHDTDLPKEKQEWREASLRDK